VRALRVPLDAEAVDAALRAEPETRGLAGIDNRERLGRELARELITAGPNPVFDRLARVIVEEQSGAAGRALDAVVVARQAPPQEGETQELLAGLYSGLAAAPVPTVGVAKSNATTTAIPVFHQRGLATVDGVDEVASQLALVFLLATSAAAAAESTTSQVAGAQLPAAAAATRAGDRLRVTDVELPATSEVVALDVQRFDVFAPDAEIVVHGASGVTRLPAPANAYFRGTVAGEDGSRVFLEVLEGGETRGVITRAGDAAYLLDSAEPDGVDERGRLQAQRADAALMKAGRDPWQCAQGDLPAPPQTVAGWDAINAATTNALAAAAADPVPPQPLFAYTARVAVETDFEYYAKFNNVTNATNYVGNLLGYSSTIYSTQINTSLVVQSVSLWTTSSDPWTQTSTLCGLMEFGRYWNLNRTGVSLTIAHFMSGKSLGGGIAWLGVLCSGGFGASASCPGVPTDAAWGGGYGFTASISGTFNVNNPTVMWDIMAVSHEIGHNFNSPHTHCYANIGGNPSPIDVAYLQTPIPTRDFYQGYREAGGTAEGGYCAYGRGRPGWFAVGGMMLVLVLWRRRR